VQLEPLAPREIRETLELLARLAPLERLALKEYKARLVREFFLRGV
jgi:hypothetical protein